jgi:alpha-L-arabinofuranosidase
MIVDMKPKLSLARALIVAAMLVGLGVFPEAAVGVEIRVDAGQLEQRINPEMFGSAVIYRAGTMGFNAWVSDQRGYEEAVAKWNYYLPVLNELGLTALRYPDGLGANNFHWKPGIGPIEQRDPDYDGAGIPQTFGTDEFLRYCEELGAEPNLVVNVSTAGRRVGTVQDAADWVEYCNAPNDGTNPGGGIDWAARRAENGHKEPYGVKFWELGNEDTYPGFGDYARRVREYSAAMKAIDPTIELGVIRTGTGLDALFGRSAWLDYISFMLNEAGDSFDFWIQHTYPPGASGMVKGLEIYANGGSLSVDFRVEQEGDYTLLMPIEGVCSGLQCPSLTLRIDGTEQGTWTLRYPLNVLQAGFLHLEAGSHNLRLEVANLSTDNHITVPLQFLLSREGKEESLWIDLRNSSAFYHAMVAAWLGAEESLAAAKPYGGDKSVFFTEANSQYYTVKSPPYTGKACAVREMLNLAGLYLSFLRNGVGLTNYWMLFQEHDGIGLLEGVGYDGEANEIGRMDPHKRPAFHLLKAYRWNMFDWLVSTEVLASPSFLTGPQSGFVIGYARGNHEVDYVSALSTLSEQGDDLSLFVLNLHPTENLPVEIDLAGFQPKSSCKVLTLTGSSPGANNEPEDCPGGDCVVTEEESLRIAGNHFSYVFPKHSLTVFVFHASGSDQASPQQPTGLWASATEEGVHLRWNENPEADVAGYFIYRSRCTEGPFSHRVSTALITENELLDTSVDDQVTYTYAVSAVDRHNNESILSTKLSIPFPSGAVDPEDPPVGGEDGSPPSAPILLKAR